MIIPWSKMPFLGPKLSQKHIKMYELKHKELTSATYSAPI